MDRGPGFHRQALQFPGVIAARVVAAIGQNQECRLRRASFEQTVQAEIDAVEERGFPFGGHRPQFTQHLIGIVGGGHIDIRRILHRDHRDLVARTGFGDERSHGMVYRFQFRPHALALIEDDHRFARPALEHALHQLLAHAVVQHLEVFRIQVFNNAPLAIPDAHRDQHEVGGHSETAVDGGPLCLPSGKARGLSAGTLSERSRSKQDNE